MLLRHLQRKITINCRVPSHTDRPDNGGARGPCSDLAFRSDGSQLIAAVGTRVLVYDAAEGDLLHSLKGHKDMVYCVAYSRDGKRFASGGADKTVIIWTSKAEGILKYNHNDPVQCLAYNPVTQQLASGTANDFGIWSPEQKSVSKRKASKVLSISWSADGQFLALGTYSGRVSLCDKSGTEKMRIERTAPVWTLQWNSTVNNTSDSLVVGCWDGTISFYNLSGKQIGKDLNLGFDPCSITYHDKKFLCIAGSHKRILFYTKEGVQLVTLCETSDWVWTVKSHPKKDFIAFGGSDGSISMLQLVYFTVHGLHLERYAFRDSLTDAVVHNLTSNVKIRIKCQEYILKLAVFQKRLAVQLPKRIAIYEIHDCEDDKDGYRFCFDVKGDFDCNLLVLTSEHLTLCQEACLRLYGLNGTKDKEWHLSSAIRYVKVCNGTCGGESLLVGLKDGSILKIWINIPFPRCIYSHTSSIRCLDISTEQTQLAAVDENGNIFVYDIKKKQIVFEDKYASSVAWNTQMEEMLCYAGSGTLNIKTANFPVHRQNFHGYVVGFQGSKLFCLQDQAMQALDLPLSWSMKHYIDSGDFDNAYQVACLGVTEADWRYLGLESIKAHFWNIAHGCFSRLQDICYLDLINQFEKDFDPDRDRLTLLATVCAYQGRFEEAAELYCQAGEIQKAMEMFADLHMFDDAKAIAEKTSVTDRGSKTTVQEIIKKQAEWTEEKNDHATAAEMYLIAGQPEKALTLIVEHGPPSKLIEVVRRLNKLDTRELCLCAELMKLNGLHIHALETYTKLGDFRSVLLLHIEMQQWDDAFALKNLHPELDVNVFHPYAEWLVSQGQYEKARIAYKQAGHTELSIHLLKQLLKNAIKEKRFRDASYICLQLFHEKRESPEESGKLMDVNPEYYSLWKEAEVYFAYSFIDQAINEPFRSSTSETLFNISVFLLGRISQKAFPGISVVNILVTLAKHGEEIGCHKSARLAYARLQGLRVPASWMDKLDVAALAVRARAAISDELNPSLECACCYCCGTSLPVASTSWKDECSFCSQPVIRSFVSFEQLPIVEFFLEDGITHETAKKLLRSRHCRKPSEGSNQHDLKQISGGQWRTMLHRNFCNSSSRQKPGPLRANEHTLTSLHPRQVIIQDVFMSEQHRYFYMIDPAFFVCQCESCNQFFEQEEWDAAILKEGSCPFCKSSGSKLQSKNISGMQQRRV
ncbi:hypothetical protein KP509_02G092100 [Ceratopteris richardii]|uniref:Intraflagellar transport protein 122 homolog n=1 Tax=Ceratopteris richardii TaxID=49495 RepID=A0A8T2VGF2_CERRI|nr:hypothetical protein KP509_02G092100 [Ceratopteris richardii]